MRSLVFTALAVVLTGGPAVANSRYVKVLIDSKQPRSAAAAASLGGLHTLEFCLVCVRCVCARARARRVAMDTRAC